MIENTKNTTLGGSWVNDIGKKTSYFVTAPSYVDRKEKELVWNSNTNRYEF